MSEKKSQVEEKQVEEEEDELLSILLDEDNTDPIILESEDGKEVKFDQIATIPFNNKLYAVLKPIDELEGVAEDEAIVLRAETVKGKTSLQFEMDDKIADRVFAIYNKMVDEEEGKN